MNEQRPRTRGECIDQPRPCPWVSCRYHLVVEVTPAGSVTVGGRSSTMPDKVPLNGRSEHFVERAAEAVACARGDTCALDVADRGEHTLEAVAVTFNLTRERVRQIERRGMRRAGALVGRQGVADG